MTRRARRGRSETALPRALAGALRRQGLRGRRILVAVSGGVDSVALAHALREISERWALELAIGHVNHGLRGADAEADQALVEALGVKLGLAALVERVAPHAARCGGTSRDRPSLQEAARTLRYAALARMAGRVGAECIATAHHADDQAETLLLRLLRGTGPDGLAGIPERSPDGGIVRPLLAATRAEIERFAAGRGLVWREDASNASPRYARNRLRRDWLPGLAQAFNPRLLRALAGLAEAQRRDSEWLEAAVAAEAAERFTMDGEWLRIDLEGWRQLPESLSLRLARQALRRCGAGRLAARVHLARIDALLRSGARRASELPGGLSLRGGAGEALLGPAGAAVAADGASAMLRSRAAVGIPPREVR
jgi:tRNA(Ile)-lysidine synthase